MCLGAWAGAHDREARAVCGDCGAASGNRDACWLGTNVHIDGGERAGEGESRKRTGVGMFELA